MKKLISIILILTFFTYLCGCQKPQTDKNKANIGEINYIITERPETQARTKISVIDGKVYCMWLDVTYNNEGRESEIFVLDMFDNGSWKNISRSDDDSSFSQYFKNSYKYPLYEKVGDKIVYTNSNNDFYVYDDISKESYDLKMNLEDWRMFETDNESVFAVLSAYGNKNGNADIRIYSVS